MPGYWIRAIQRSAFFQEIQSLLKGRPLPKLNPLLRLTPFIDQLRMLRVEGRLRLHCYLTIQDIR